MAKILTDLAGTPKNSSVNAMFASARLANPNAKKPLPRVCRPGGVANADTSCSTHHANVTSVNSTVRYRRIRTVHKLYGVTAGSSGRSSPRFESRRFGSRRVCSSGGGPPWPTTSSSSSSRWLLLLLLFRRSDPPLSWSLFLEKIGIVDARPRRHL
jgi:hypothetical protein